MKVSFKWIKVGGSSALLLSTGSVLFIEAKPVAGGSAAPDDGSSPGVVMGPYSSTRGHHIHQSASYGTGDARLTNPNHYPAITIAIGPGFTEAQHARASAVQRTINQGYRGTKEGVFVVGRVQISITGNGTLPAAPDPNFEDVKAYYSLRAAGRSDTESLRSVNRSSMQLRRTNTGPLRVPAR